MDINARAIVVPEIAKEAKDREESGHVILVLIIKSRGLKELPY